MLDGQKTLDSRPMNNLTKFSCLRGKVWTAGGIHRHEINASSAAEEVLVDEL